jgi:TolA-binding protein
MRFQRGTLIGLVLLASVAMPAAAQRAETIDRRVDRLEQELRAVQRRVFPDANGPVIAPEIGGAAPISAPSGVPATSPVADLNARLDALETQLRSLTGQVEQGSNRLRLVEQEQARLREGVGARLDALEHAVAAAAATAPPPAAAATAPARPREPASPPVRSAAPPASSPRAPSDPAEAEAAYNAGFHLWEQKRYDEAERALDRIARDYPDTKWASWAANLAGRAWLDAGHPTTAAKAFFANYQNNPNGERAQDSLYYLGRALIALGKPAEACKAYDELRDHYGRAVRDSLKQPIAAARAEAKCGR